MDKFPWLSSLKIPHYLQNVMKYFYIFPLILLFDLNLLILYYYENH